MIFLIISSIILILSFLIFKQVAGSLRITQLNMISWIFFYNLILQSFIASILVVNNIDNHYLISKISDPDSRTLGWLSVQYTMIMLPLGMLMVVYLAGYTTNNQLFQSYVHSSTRPLLSTKDSYIRYPFYLLSMISIMSVIYVMITLDRLPIVGIIKGLGYEELSLIRHDASRAFSGNLYVKNIFALGLTPILSYTSYAYYKITNDKRDLLLFVVLFISSFFILTHNIAKAPFIQYLLGFMFLNVLIYGSVKRSTVYSIVAIIMSILVGLYMLIGNVIDLSSLFSYNSGIIGRVLLGQSAGTYLTFDIFPHSVAHIGFGSISNLLNNTLGLEESERSARILMEHFNPVGIKMGIAGVLNSLFIAEAWANFGLLGALFSPFYVGAIIQALFITFLKLPKTPLFLGLFTYFSYRGSLTGGFNDYLYNAGYFVVVFFIFLIYFIGQRLKIVKRKRFEKDDISPPATSL